MTNRTPTDTVTRCTASEGSQQCVAARHPKMQNHRWGPKGETDQWNADGTQKVIDHDAVTDVIPQVGAHRHESSNGVVTGHAHPHDGPHEHPEDNPPPVSRPAITNGQPPSPASMAPGHSIADVATNDTIDTLLFDDFDPQLKFEKIWVRIATNTLLRITAEYHRHGMVADLGLVMAMRDHIDQIVANRGPRSGS